MEAKVRVRWQKLVDSFQVPYMAGLQPWDANKANAGLRGRSDGEKEIIRFLLGVWDPGTEWDAGMFDLQTALRSWDEVRKRAFVAWVQDPWWP